LEIVEVTNFKWSRGEWDNVLVQAKFKTYLSEGTAIANSKENTLILLSGTKMKLSDDYGIFVLRKEKPDGQIIILIARNKILLFYLMVQHR